MRPIRVALADDHTLFRAGVVSLLREVDDIEVVGHTGDGQETLALVKEIEPDVLLLDISLPGLNGLDVARKLSGELPRVGIIILTMHMNEEYILHAGRAGVAGYVLKDSAVGQLVRAIRTVAQGRRFFAPGISRELIAGGCERGGKKSQRGSSRLTPRQREILQLIAEGYRTKGIAGRLNISVKTVETHRSQIMERLNIHDIPGLVCYAIREGLVATD